MAEPARAAVTLADVAARAGVSLNTVSRALRAPHTVRPPLRRRIEEVLDELNYVPNRLAGGLAGSHTGVVGVILTSLFFSEFAAVVDTLQADLAAAGFNVMLGNSRYDPDEELRLVRAMLSWRPAAMALVGIDRHPRAADLLRASGIPVIEVWDAVGEAIDSAVGMDHSAIGAMQTRHLLAQGYRRPAFIGCVRVHDYRAHKRLAGYQAAAREAGLDYVHVPVPSGGMQPGHLQAFRQAVDRHDGPFLAYCRSGTRSCHLWAFAAARTRSADAVIESAAAAGYDLSGSTPLLERIAAEGLK